VAADRLQGLGGRVGVGAGALPDLGGVHAWPAAALEPAAQPPQMPPIIHCPSPWARATMRPSAAAASGSRSGGRPVRAVT
jgi:hypothetical protein